MILRRYKQMKEEPKKEGVKDDNNPKQSKKQPKNKRK
jgi:hypothetical protein